MEPTSTEQDQQDRPKVGDVITFRDWDANRHVVGKIVEQMTDRFRVEVVTISWGNPTTVSYHPRFRDVVEVVKAAAK